MLKETLRILGACFIGGAVFAGTTLGVAPELWGLAMLPGFVVGYLAYRFRDVMKAVPQALSAAHKDYLLVWEETREELRAYFAEPHPIFFPSVGIAAGCIGSFLIFVILPDVQRELPGSTEVMMLAMMIIIFFVVITFAAFMLITFVMFIGARVGERCFWRPLAAFKNPAHADSVVKFLLKQGYTEAPWTYRNAGRWFLKGLWLIARYPFWTFWKHLALVSCEVFKIVYSDERLLCGVASALGGAIAHFCFGASASGLFESTIYILFGGACGATVGLISYELVSKRWLKLVKA